MKTYRNWQESNIYLEEYLTEPCQIDEEMYNYFGGVVPPNYCDGNYVQIGEAMRERNDVLLFETVMKIGKKYYYIGVLPDFKLMNS